MNERGQALVETLLLGILLLVPLIWSFGVLAELHGAALASTSAARDAGVSAAGAANATEVQVAIDSAVHAAFRDHRLHADAVDVRWTARHGVGRGELIEIRVRYPVRVLRAPLIGSVAGPAVWVDARHVARLHPFASRP